MRPVVLNICSVDTEHQVSGWCAIECCDSYTEETCYEYDDGYSKPYTNQYCAAVRLFVSMPLCHCHSNAYHLLMLMDFSHFSLSSVISKS
jgi:hypothetical protein